MAVQTLFLAARFREIRWGRRQCDDSSIKSGPRIRIPLPTQKQVYVDQSATVTAK
jgi:hypothetical protein